MSSKKKYKAADVCRELGIQPYVLRYWETEFAPLREDRAKTTYSGRHLDAARRIKELLYDEGYTIAGAKKKLQAELAESGEASPPASTAQRVRTQQELLVEEGEAAANSDGAEQPEVPSASTSGELHAEGEASASADGEQNELEAAPEAPPDASEVRTEAATPEDAGAGEGAESDGPAAREEQNEPPNGDGGVDAHATPEQIRQPSSHDAGSERLDSVAQQRIQTIAHGLRALRREARELLAELSDS